MNGTEMLQRIIEVKANQIMLQTRLREIDRLELGERVAMIFLWKALHCEAILASENVPSEAKLP